MDIQELLKSLGLSVARGVPQMASGFVDLAALPFTATGLLKPEQAVGSTDWMTARGYLPPKQPGLLNETTELVSSALNPSAAMKASAAGLLGLTAYHGSPHLFKKFNLEKVGTGEGNQAFGHGMYFAENQDVAKHYALSTPKTVSSETYSIENIANRLYEGGFDDEYIKNRIKSVIPNANDELIERGMELARLDKPAGNVYKVDIPDEQIPKMLDWNKPISQQPIEIQEIAKQFGVSKRPSGKEATGGNLYETIANMKAEPPFNNTSISANYKYATKYLQDRGIPGIRYLDQGSKAASEGTSNFVIFDPSKVKTQEINDIPLEEWIRKGLLD